MKSIANGVSNSDSPFKGGKVIIDAKWGPYVDGALIKVNSKVPQC